MRTIKAFLRRMVRPPLHGPEVALDYVFLGTEYGGWPLLKNTTPGALVYSFGIGTDISFDIAAIEKFRCIVHGFDPTPRSKLWIEKQSLADAFTFHPIGIADRDGEASFFPPKKDGNVSFSARPAEGVGSDAAVTAKVLRLETIINKLETGNPDILKMDIEGFEYKVIDDFLQSSVRPKQLLIEFHHRMYGISNEETVDAVKKLNAAGYKLFFVSSGGHEYGFVLDERAIGKP